MQVLIVYFLYAQYNLDKSLFSCEREVILEANSVHFYCKSLTCSDSQLARYQKIISVDELSRAKKFVRESDQQKFIVSKALTREILAKYTQKNPAEIEFVVAEHGKPFLKDNALQFNVSHSGDCFLMGVTRDSPIGVDVEHMRENRDYLGLAKRFFAPAEFQAIKNQADFYRTWTCKEAFIKATGLGLSFGLSNFEIDIASNEKSILGSVRGDRDAAREWTVKSIELGEFSSGYFAAYCVRGAAEIEYWNYHADL